MAELGEGSGVAIGPQKRLAIDLQPRFGKLKPGPGLPPEQVRADQRRRLHAATIALIDSAGWDGVRVRALARTAGVSTATFYKHFVNVDDCLASTYDAVMDGTLRRASSAAQRSRPDWRKSLRAVVGSLMNDLAREPREARLVLIGIFAAGPTARKRTGRAVGELEELIAACFTTAPRTVAPPRHLVAGMAAGLLRVARTTTLAGRADELPGLADELSGWMLALPSPEVLSLLAAPPASATGHPRRELQPFPSQGAAGDAWVDTDDRERLLRATAKLAMAEGFGKLTAPRIRAAAGVSRRRFDAHFASLDECFLESVEAIAVDAAGQARTWSERSHEWERRTCRFVAAMCAQAARNRAAARLAFFTIFATGAIGLQRREQMIARTATILRATVPAGRRPSPLWAEASVAAAWYIAQVDTAAGRTRSLPRVAPLLSYVILTPIVGARKAASTIRNEAQPCRPSVPPKVEFAWPAMVRVVAP